MSNGGECANAWPTPPNPDLECRAIRTGAACVLDGKMCPDLFCGLADSGRRACFCDGGIWSCTPCDFTLSGFAKRRPFLPSCSGAELDKVTCAQECAICVGPVEVCACYVDDEGVLIWDCDKPPTTW